MKTLYKQYIVVTLLVIAASVAISMLVLGQIYNMEIRPDSDKANVEIAEEVTNNLAYMQDGDYTGYLQSVAKLGYQVVVVNEENETASFGTTFKEMALNAEMTSIIGTNEIYHGIMDYKERFVFMNHFANDVQNTIGVPFTFQNEQYALFIRPDNALLFSEMHFLIIAFIFISAIFILGAMLFLARGLVQPLKQLQRATEQISQENYDIELQIDRHDELGQLASQFQKMAKRLAENDQLKKDFINNVSHDFQSPLLNIQGYANVLKDADNTEEERVQYLEIIEQETKRLSALTKQLLLLSSLDQKNLPIEKKTFALDQQLKELLFSKRWMLDDRQMELVYELEPILIHADKHLLEQVWDNLLINAVRYSEDKGKIVVTCKRVDQHVIVSIEDEGIGIPADALEKVKERFYRVDPSRSSQSSGLGLAIVTEIVARHDGEFIIQSELGVGTEVSVFLKIA
jgi:signal transduction histidine kinase